MMGNWLDRKHAFEHDQILEDRTVLRLPITRLSRRQWGRVAEARAREQRRAERRKHS